MTWQKVHTKLSRHDISVITPSGAFMGGKGYKCVENFIAMLMVMMMTMMVMMTTMAVMTVMIIMMTITVMTMMFESP